MDPAIQDLPSRPRRSGARRPRKLIVTAGRRPVIEHGLRRRRRHVLNGNRWSAKWRNYDEVPGSSSGVWTDDASC